MDITYDELFALRLNYQDYFNDEFLIIKRLKEDLYLRINNIEEVNNLRIIRIKVGDRSKSRFHRALIEMTYSSKIISMFKENNFIDLDRVICYSPSIFFGKAVKWIKNTHRVPAYLVIRDIFPKWALDARLLKKGLIYYYFKYCSPIPRTILSILNYKILLLFYYYKK